MYRAGPLHLAKAEFFRTLGHPARTRILELLRDGECSVRQLQAELGLDSGGTSQHLSALRRAGFVKSRRDGTSVYYSVADKRVFRILTLAREMIANSLEAQQALLEELNQE
jgi:DNA-binding transcriptional ArsR family regulator